MSLRTVLADVIPEKSTWRYTGVLKDETDVVVAAAQLTTLTLTLYALDAALTIINSVDAVNILNTGRGTVHATNGTLTIVFLPADSPIIDATLIAERHLALIQWTYAGGAKAGRHEVEFEIRNLSKVS
jgi:hypothetical protein